MKVLACPDKFKGTATATEVANAICDAASTSGHDCAAIPMADGGEGTLAALGGANRVSTVTGPAGDRVEAEWRLDRGVAVIEMAEAAGLVLAGGPTANDPLDATTRGVGELIGVAVDAGARQIIVGVGGSATTDGGLGALEAIGSSARLAGIDIVVACDVRTLFVDAAEVFAPQKGATSVQVELLRRRLERLADEYRRIHDVDVRTLPRSGAAGGLAGGLAAFGARLVDGFDVVATAVGLGDSIERADLVVTGEGFLDNESFRGKVVGGVASLAEASNVPLVVVAGQVFDGAEDLVRAVSLVEEYGMERAMSAPLECVADAVTTILATSN